MDFKVLGNILMAVFFLSYIIIKLVQKKERKLLSCISYTLAGKEIPQAINLLYKLTLSSSEFNSATIIGILVIIYVAALQLAKELKE